jgi:hypothetical protein
VLNTLLLKLMLLTGNSPFILRLPNILAGVLYTYSAHGIASVFFRKVPQLRMLLFAALLLNPMLAEFFALARGYGLSISLLTFFVLRLCHIAIGSRGWIMHSCYMAGVLAVYSNFSMLLPVLCIWGLALIFQLYPLQELQHRKRLLKIIFPSLTYSALLWWLIYKPITYLIAAKALFHGGRKNFIADTWASMISDLAGLRPRNFEAFDSGNYVRFPLLFWMVVSLLALIIAAVLIIRKYLQPPLSGDQRIALIPLAILLGCIIGINAQFYLQGTPLINYRVALYLYPLLILTLFAAIRLCLPYYPVWGSRMAIAMVALLLLNYSLQLKVTYTTEWPFDAHNEKVCTWIQNDHPGPAKARLYAFMLMIPSINFYITTKYGHILEKVPDIGNVADICSADYDYSAGL